MTSIESRSFREITNIPILVFATWQSRIVTLDFSKTSHNIHIYFSLPQVCDDHPLQGLDLSVLAEVAGDLQAGAELAPLPVSRLAQDQAVVPQLLQPGVNILFIGLLLTLYSLTNWSEYPPLPRPACWPGGPPSPPARSGIWILQHPAQYTGSSHKPCTGCWLNIE